MTRTVLRLLGTRYGIALVLVVLVLVAVGLARAAGGPSKPSALTGPPPSAAPSTSASDTALGDDSVATSESPQTPSSAPGSRPPDAVALDFARAWVRTDGVSGEQWLKGMTPYATTGLIERMQGADPATVPADAVRDGSEMRVRDSELVEVSVPVSPGLLRLRVVLSSGRWLVDSVDWERP
jgi:hypothetical protein